MKILSWTLDSLENQWRCFRFKGISFEAKVWNAFILSIIFFVIILDFSSFVLVDPLRFFFEFLWLIVQMWLARVCFFYLPLSVFGGLD